MNKERQIILKRLNTLVLNNYQKDKKNTKANDKYNSMIKIAFKTELYNLGYSITNLDLLTIESLKTTNISTLIDILKKKKGGEVDYVPLFSNFPEDIPTDQDFFEKRILGIIISQLENFNSEDLETENNLDNISDILFDLEKFGANPITLRQVKDIYNKAKEDQNFRKSDNINNSELFNINIVLEGKESDKLLEDFLYSLFYSSSSIQEYLKEDINYLLENTNIFSKINFNKVKNREIKSYLSSLVWKKLKDSNTKLKTINNDLTKNSILEKGLIIVNIEKDINILKNILTNPTDILRMFASLENQDISLSENITFPKLNRFQRKLIIDILNNLVLGKNREKNIDDIIKYSGLWKSIANYLHLGENKYKRLFPEVLNIFSELRSGKLKSIESRIQEYIAKKDIISLVNELKRTPGKFARKLHELVRLKNKDKHNKLEEAFIIAHFYDISYKIELKQLLIMKKYFENINNSEKRTIINKKGKIVVIENNLPKLDNEILDIIINMLDNSIKNKFNTIEKTKENKNIDIDKKEMIKDLSKLFDTKKQIKIILNEDLKNILIPLSLRKTSESSLVLGRGSKIKIKEDINTIRLFTYWKEQSERTDLDLSLITLDNKFSKIEHISYTNMSSEYGNITHSGDLTSAPYGAAEFIDIDIKSIKEKTPNVKYIVSYLFRYEGENFRDTEKTYIGWMYRDNVDSDHRSFDIKTVENKINVSGAGNNYLPIIIDIEENDIYYIDLYNNDTSFSGNNIEGEERNISMIVKELLNFNKTKPNLYELLNYRINSNKNIKIVKDNKTNRKNKEIITFGSDIENDINLTNKKIFGQI